MLLWVLCNLILLTPWGASFCYLYFIHEERGSSNGKIMSLFSLNKYLSSAFFVPGTVQSIGDVVVFSADRILAFVELVFSSSGGQTAASGTGVVRAEERSTRGRVEGASVPS